MIPTRQDQEWLVGVVGLHLCTTSEFGRRERKYVDVSTVAVIHDSTYTIRDSSDIEPNSRSGLMEAVAEAIYQTAYRPGRIRVKSSMHEDWLRSLSFMDGVEIVEDPQLDLDAILEKNPVWTLNERPPASHLLQRLHTAAAQLRHASASYGAGAGVDVVFDLPALGVAGTGRLQRDKPGLEGLYLSRFELAPPRSDSTDVLWEVFGLDKRQLPETVELLHLTREDASPMLREERAEFVRDGEPYPIVECEGNKDLLRDAGEREVHVVCLVAQGLAAFLHAEGKNLRKRPMLRGEYDARWGNEVFTVRIARPRRWW